MLYSFVFAVEFAFDLVQGAEEPACSYARPKKQQADCIPADHVPLRSVRTFDAKLYCFAFQLFCNAGHPEKRVNEDRRDAQKICDPVALRAAAENAVYLILQSAQRHIEEEKQAGGEEIQHAKQEARSSRMLKLFCCLFSQVVSRYF